MVYKSSSIAPTGSSSGTGGGTVSTITSSGGTITVTNPTGPTTNLEVASAASGVATQYSVAQTAHGLSVGNVVRYNGAAYVIAQADSVSNAEAIGIVSVVTDANNFTLIEQGEITTLSGLTAGVTYFLSASSAGALTATEPVADGQISKPLLISTATTSGVFNNMRGKIQQAASTNVNSVSNSDGSLTISPTTGAVIASLNLSHANAWDADILFASDATYNLADASNRINNFYAINHFGTSFKDFTGTTLIDFLSGYVNVPGRMDFGDNLNATSGSASITNIENIAVNQILNKTGTGQFYFSTYMMMQNSIDFGSSFGILGLGSFNMPPGASSGYVMTSDVSGTGTWQPISFSTPTLSDVLGAGNSAGGQDIIGTGSITPTSDLGNNIGGPSTRYANGFIYELVDASSFVSLVTGDRRLLANDGTTVQMDWSDASSPTIANGTYGSTAVQSITIVGGRITAISAI